MLKHILNKYRFFSDSAISPFVSTRVYRYQNEQGSLVCDYAILNSKGNKTSQMSYPIIDLLKTQNAILILTEPSRFLVKERKEANYSPIEVSSIEDLRRLKASHKKLIPDPGHICAALTDNKGIIIGDLSFRPDRGKSPIVESETTLHPTFYEASSHGIQHASFKTFSNEMANANRIVEKDPSVILYLSIITGENITHKLSQLCEIFERIKDEKNPHCIAIYNLCTSFVRRIDLTKLNDRNAKEEIYRLIEQAEKIIYSHSTDISFEGKHRVAAQACGHALAKAFLNDTHKLERTIGPDLSTQQYAAHIIAAIIHDKSYLKETPLLDDTANIVNTLVSQEQYINTYYKSN